MASRTFMPAAGRDVFLPLYDPITRLLGGARLHRALIEQAELQPDFRVLDVGCGTGTLAVTIKRLHPTIGVVALDPDPRALARAQRKAQRAGVALHFDRGFADALPYRDASFERVFSSLMFHHLRKSEKETTLREIRRVLKPGGRLEFLDLASGSHTPGLLARLIHGRPHAAGGPDARLRELMTRAGFENPTKVRDHHTVFGRIASYQAARPA